MSTRRGAVVLFGILAVALMATACQSNKTEASKIVVIFVDVSKSVKDYQVYRDAWAKITSRLRGGDRIVLGAINDQTYTAFRAVLDREIPTLNYLTDNKLTYEGETRKVDQEISTALERVLSQSRSPKTDVMNALALAEKIFGGDRRRPVIVLLSDMLEDSEEHNFERDRLTEGFAHRIIEEKRSKGQLPDLGGATAYVAGASAQSAVKAKEVERFWLDFVTAANGRLLPQNYGPALLSFNE